MEAKILGGVVDIERFEYEIFPCIDGDLMMSKPNS